MTIPYFAELQYTHTQFMLFWYNFIYTIQTTVDLLVQLLLAIPPFRIGFMLAGWWLMGFVDYFNHAGADVMEVMLDELLLLLLTLHFTGSCQFSPQLKLHTDIRFELGLDKEINVRRYWLVRESSFEAYWNQRQRLQWSDVFTGSYQNWRPHLHLTGLASGYWTLTTWWQSGAGHHFNNRLHFKRLRVH